MTTRRVFVLAFAILAAMLAAAILSQRAEAASFDCPSAAQPMEKLICSDPTLSELDEQMARAYGNAIGALPSDRAAVLKSSQRAWLRLLRTTCRIEAPEALPCVIAAYQRRLREFAGGPTVIGPYVLTIVTKSWTPLSSDCSVNPLTRSSSYPVFMEPLSEDQRRWNSEISARVERETEEWLEGDMSCSPDFSYSVTPMAAADGFLASRIDVSWMGATHYWSSFSTENRLLALDRSLVAEDVFADSTDWQADLAKRARALVQQQVPELNVTPDDARELAIDAGSWIVSPETLSITLALKDRYGPVHGNEDLVIPWRDLKAYLRPDLPLALKLD